MYTQKHRVMDTDFVTGGWSSIEDVRRVLGASPKPRAIRREPIGNHM